MFPPESDWFFISGCQRSGTTMLRLILECHSEIFCFDELKSYEVLSTRAHAGDIGKRLVGFKVPRFAEQLDSTRPYDLGLTEEFGRFYAHQPVLFMVRDVRDAVASMLKLRGQRSWLEDWAQPIIASKRLHEPVFARRFARELALCETSGSLAAYGALYWAYKNEALLRYTKARYPVLPISYEGLVEDPAPQLQRVCAWLGVNFQAALLEHPSHLHGELFDGGLTHGNTDPRRSIDADSVGQWRNWLSSEDARLVAEIAGPVEQSIAPLLTPVAPAVIRSRSNLPASTAPQAPAPLSIRIARGAAPALVRTSWAGATLATMLSMAHSIARQPVWSLGRYDVLFWCSALLAALLRYLELHREKPMAGDQAPPLFSQVPRQLTIFGLCAAALWLAVQSLEI